MARVKRGVTSHAKHKKVLKAAKGYYGRRKNTIRIAKQAVEKANQYAFRDRKRRKRTFRALWIQRLNAAVRPFGRVVVCGATTGPNPPAQLHRVWWKQLTVLGSTMGTREDFLGAYALVRDGRVSVHVDSVYPLREAAAAHARLESGEQLGKVVLEIPG